MKALQISLEDAKTLLKKMPELSDSIYATYPELKYNPIVPATWEDLDIIYGAFITEDSGIAHVSGKTMDEDKNIFATIKQAESALAYAQLTQLMKATGDCDVDWSNVNKVKNIINCSHKKLYILKTYVAMHPLAFNTPSIANKFMRTHEKLINQFYMK